jgi:hypothetical protein
MTSLSSQLTDIRRLTNFVSADTMFPLIRAQPTLLRRAPNVPYSIFSLTQALTGTTSTTVGYGIRQVHTPDSYSKEVDYAPPKDEKIHRVDPESELVQKPHESPSGEWSRAGVKADEYRSGEENQPHASKAGKSTHYSVRKTSTEYEEAETNKSNEVQHEKNPSGRRRK